MKRRMLSILLALSMVLTMLPTALSAKTDYADTDGHWAEKSIERWSVYGIVEGSNNLFDPNGDLSRAQLAAIIARLLNLPMAGSAGFGDTIGHWAEDVINRCAAAGIMLGDGVNARPDDPISREETMVMLGRALGIKPVENADLSGYGDSNAVADWAEGYVAAMTEAGIVNGIDGNLAPADDIDRASTMTILDRAITTYANEPGQTVEATGEGIVLVAAEDVTVTGEAETIVVTQGAAGGTTNLDNATVGTVTVQAENSSVVVGENTTVDTEGTKVETSEGTTGTVAGDKELAGGENTTTPTTPTTPSTPSVSEHDHSYTSVVTAPTCTEQGYTTHTCRCGDSYVGDYVPALGHDFENAAWTSDETGHWHICAREGCTVTDTKAAHVGLGTNCTVETSCETCGYVKAAGEHTWNDGVVAPAPTCTTAGVKTFTCTTANCGETKTETVAIVASAHNWGAWQSNTNGTHSRSCAYANHPETAACVDGTDEDTKCDTCGDEQSVYVAEVAGLKYTTLRAAIDAVRDGDTITVLSNITIDKDTRYELNGYYEGIYYEGDKSFTIDLGKFTIAQDGSVNDYFMLFKNNGEKANTITFKNGTINAGTTAYCAICTASTNSQQITINLENVNIIGNNSGGSVIKVRGGAVLNVKDGTKITGADSYLGIESAASVVNIYDGAEIYMNGTTSYNGCLVGVGSNGTVNVYGGYGKGVKGGLIAMTSGGTINVSDGEWIANTDGTDANGNKSVLIAQSDKATYKGGNSVVNVTGGTFKGGYNCYGNAVGDAQLNISGGTFSSDPSAYVAPSYEATENEDGTWTVGVREINSVDELKEVLEIGGTYVLADGEYKMPSSGTTKSITITGSKNAVIDLTLGAYLDSATLTFEGVTIKGSTGYANGNGSDYAALYSTNVTYNNCAFDGPFRIGRDGATFIGCAFNNLGNDYVWTYGNDATFTNCTFNTAGKALLIYSDGGNEVSQVSVTGCTFNATAGAKAGAIANQNCAAIEIQNYGNGVNLTTSGNTFDSNFSGEWRIKTYHSGTPSVTVNNTEYTSIAIDGKTMTIDANNNVTVNP